MSATVPTSPTVDRVMADQRAASFRTRSIKKSAKMGGLKLALSMIDLTTLEGKDSPEKIRSLCRKAIRPYERDEELLGERLPHVAAVCVYPSLVPVAKEILGGTGVNVASVATGFPSGQYPLDVRIRDVEEAVRDGADEIDMVINRGAFLSGRYDEVGQEIRAVREACGPAHLKVILETGELETYDNVRRASDIAIANINDGDFIKTSTGKVSPAATMPVTLVMLEAIRDEYLRSGRIIGMKPAGGIRDAKLALHYLVMIQETLGKVVEGTKAQRHEGTKQETNRLTDEKTEGGANGAIGKRPERDLPPNPWMSPTLFRFGASTLVNDILRQLVKQTTGTYVAEYDFSEA